MKKVLMVIAPNDFRDEEFEKPYELLKKNKIEVTVASSTGKTSKGMLGKEVTPDKKLSDVSMNDFDAVVFVGGFGAQAYFNDPKCHELARQADQQKKLVSAICIAPSILANAGLLKGKTATCWESEATNLKEKGANYTGKDVEEDGRIVTGVGPDAAQAFAEILLKRLR